MSRYTTFAFAFFVTALGASAAEAQYTGTAQACPPGQPCVVVQAQATPPTPQVAPQGYVVQQPGYGQVYAQPQRQMVQTTRTRLRWGLIGPGIAAIVIGWVGNWVTGIAGTLGLALTGATSRDTSQYFGWSWIPFAGPWVDAVIIASNWGGNDGFVGTHVLWGVLQAGGLLMCILGTVLQEEVVEMRYVQNDGPQFAVAPFGGPDGAGLNATLTF
jgi:hypothetical protein